MLSSDIINNINKVIVGKDKQIELLLVAIVAGGHVLLEDVPGTGKTKTARALAKSLSLDFKRVQFTIDLLPSDLTGINYFDRSADKFVFRKGPVFTNILLADEMFTLCCRACGTETDRRIMGQSDPRGDPRGGGRRDWRQDA